MNKDHFIIKINNELDEIIDNSFQAFEYIQLKYTKIVDYISRRPEENVLVLILLDRILHMLPYHTDYAEITLAKLKSQVYKALTIAELDNIAIAADECIKDAIEIKKLRYNVTQLINLLQRIVGSYRSNEKYNPFLAKDGEKLFK